MKKLLLILSLFLTAQLQAGITSMLVERIPETEKVASFFRVTAYGLLGNGKPKVLDLTATKDKEKSSKIENCKWGGEAGLNRTAIRYWVFFDEDTIRTIDFHMSGQWEQKVFQADTLDSQMAKEIYALKTLIEAK